MTDHRNDERTVRCPVDGCSKEVLARGVHLHVRQSSGDGHGPQGEVPGTISLDNLESVGEQEVRMDYPEEREAERHARLCPYCSQTFEGVQGLMIHLGQTAGRKNHPADPKERHEPGDFPRVEVDADGNVEQVADAPASTSSTDNGKGAVPVQRVFRLIADLTADGEIQTAHRVRHALLAANPGDVVNGDEHPHPALFAALVTHGRADETTEGVTAKLEDDGIAVACRSQSAILASEEAREIAAGLEQVAINEDWQDEETDDLVEFLRYVADLLDGESKPFEFYTDFDRWN
jgi:hypothetical protein